MSNALLSDVEARAERRRTRTQGDMRDDLATQAWQAANAATDAAENRAWLERAHRLAPADGMVAIALAGAMLRDRAFDQAAALFRAEATRHGAVEAWAGLAACAHLAGDAEVVRDALEAALRSSVPTATIRNLAAAIAPSQGWCGLSTQGVLHASVPGTAAARAKLDGAALALAWKDGAARLPPAWRTGRTLAVEGDHGPLLGSPLPLPAFAGLEGFVESVQGGLAGWAWHTADPSVPPRVRIEGERAARTLRLVARAEDVRLPNPLVRPFRFSLTPEEAAALGTVLRVTGPDGRHLTGSPLDPGLEARGGMTPAWAGTLGPPPPEAAPRPVNVVVPVYRGLAETLACLDSVRAALPRGARLVVVDDASPDLDLVAALDLLACRRRIVLLRLPANRGFPAAANAGIADAAGRDVVLLNSDTLVPPGWLERLRAAAYSAPGIGTVTPLTNDGTIVSIPDPAGGNPMPDLPGTIAQDALAQRANGAATTEIPVGVGFCLYIRRDCLDQVGPLREDVFAQGYGEENDFCLRARQRGWRSVAVLGVFVAHAGATSFGASRSHLMRRNAAILERLHPGYGAMVAAHLAADPLLAARRRIDALRWEAGRRREGAVVLVTHAGGGGVDRVVDARARDAAAAGQRAIVVRPGRGGVRVHEPGGLALPNPVALDALPGLLRRDRVRRLELHHMLGHDAALAGLAARMGAEAVSVVHDYARFCPRIALVSTNRRYCGEPDLAGCEACIADLGSLLEDDPPVATLRARSAAELAAAARVIVPSPDAARRMRRHFPGLRTEVVPWGDDAALPPLAPASPGPVLRVAVVGAIGTEKGFDVLLACARDARARGLPIAFVVVGYTADDARLMAAGPVFVTGAYAEHEAVTLLRAQGAHLALIPSVWPETWCFALTCAWEAGLPAAVFDLGAQADRVRATGRGWLLPLGLPPGSLNDALLRLAPAPAACDVRRGRV